MPDTTVTPVTPEDPSILDVGLHHPAETVIALWWVYIGLVLLDIQLGTGESSVGVLPSVPALILCADVALGGLLALLGLYWRGDARSTAWKIEKWGWVLGGIGWLAYAAAVAVNSPSRFGIGLGVAMVLAAVARLVALHIGTGRTRRNAQRFGLIP